MGAQHSHPADRGGKGRGVEDPISAFNSLGLVYFPYDGHSEDAESNAAGSQAAGIDVPVRVFEGVYLGTMSTAGDYASLTSVGTTHVLNMSNYEGNESKHMPQHFEYLILNMSDSLGIHRHLHGASHFIEEGRSRGSVLVHCTHPKSALSVAAVLAYLMTFQRASLQKASSLVQESFPFCLAQELEEQLLEYQASVLHKPAPDPPHSHVPREASAQTSKIENDDMVIRYQWQPPPESRERAPSRVLRQSYEENRKPPLQDEMLYLSSKESVWHGTDPLLTLAVQNYWTRPATKLSPARNHEQHTICSAQGQGGAESPCLDLSAYTSRTDDLQHQQHALLVATGQEVQGSETRGLRAVSKPLLTETTAPPRRIAARDPYYDSRWELDEFWRRRDLGALA